MVNKYLIVDTDYWDKNQVIFNWEIIVIKIQVIDNIMEPSIMDTIEDIINKDYFIDEILMGNLLQSYLVLAIMMGYYINSRC